MCALGNAGTLECISASFKSVNISIRSRQGAQGEGSRHVSLLYLHSLAVFVSYISSNERKIKKINNTLFVPFYILVHLLTAVCVHQVSKSPIAHNKPYIYSPFTYNCIALLNHSANNIVLIPD